MTVHPSLTYTLESRKPTFQFLHCLSQTNVLYTRFPSSNRPLNSSALLKPTFPRFLPRKMRPLQHLSTLLLLPALTAILYAPVAQAGLSGSGWVTTHDYPTDGPQAPFNPPFCGMPYAELNLDFITAVSDLEPNQCGTCLQICGDHGCDAVLAVDKGGRGLDLSTGLKGRVIGPHDDWGRVTWKPIDSQYCSGIWTGH